MKVLRWKVRFLYYFLMSGNTLRLPIDLLMKAHHEPVFLNYKGPKEYFSRILIIFFLYIYISFCKLNKNDEGKKEKKRLIGCLYKR